MVMSMILVHGNANEFYPVDVVDHYPADIDQFYIYLQNHFNIPDHLYTCYLNYPLNQL